MPPPFQTLTASKCWDYVTVVWRKAQNGPATSEWTRFQFCYHVILLYILAVSSELNFFIDLLYFGVINQLQFNQTCRLN